MNWSRSDDVLGTDIDGGTVLLNMDTGKYVSLNFTAAAIWEELEEPSSEVDIANMLVERFEIDFDAAKAATGRLLAKLAAEKLLKQQSA